MQKSLRGLILLLLFIIYSGLTTLCGPSRRQPYSVGDMNYYLANPTWQVTSGLQLTYHIIMNSDLLTYTTAHYMSLTGHLHYNQLASGKYPIKVTYMYHFNEQT